MSFPCSYKVIARLDPEIDSVGRTTGRYLMTLKAMGGRRDALMTQAVIDEKTVEEAAPHVDIVRHTAHKLAEMLADKWEETKPSSKPSLHGAGFSSLCRHDDGSPIFGEG